MFAIQVDVFIICLVSLQTITCVCEKSFVVICDSLYDVQRNSSRKTWSELLIQQNFYDENPSKDTLKSQQLNRDLSNLKWLTINRKIKEIEGNPFTYCKNLQNLILYGNDLKIIKRSTFVGFRNLLKLGLENNNIYEIQKNAFILSKIELINLSYNKLVMLKSNLFKKCQVKAFSITHNKLLSIEIDSLPTNLEILHLDHNSLISPPDELRNLKQLEELTISYNDLTDTSKLSQVNSLKKLDLSFNKIASIHQEFNKMQRLRYLDLSGNNLEKFTFTSHFIENMINIKDNFALLLADNRLRNLDLQHVSNAEITVTMSGNPWSCKCFYKMQLVMKNSNITQTACDQLLFGSGQNPYCVLEDDEECLEQRVKESTFKKFRSLSQNKICDVYSDVDVFVN